MHNQNTFKTVGILRFSKILWKIFLSDKSNFVLMKYVWTALICGGVGTLYALFMSSGAPNWIEELLAILGLLWIYSVTIVGTCAKAYLRLYLIRNEFDPGKLNEAQFKVIRQTFVGDLNHVGLISLSQMLLTFINIILLVVVRFQANIVSWLKDERHNYSSMNGIYSRF